LVTHALVMFNELAGLPAEGYTSGVSNQHLRAAATLGRAAVTSNTGWVEVRPVSPALPGPPVPRTRP
jgi:hypothetical protein